MQKSMKRKAFQFLLLIGLISLLSDFTHEGARSIYGPYLAVIGASAFVVALTAGLGEFIGQTLRIVTGIIADKTKKYWLMMIFGYSINLLVIPLLMFVDANIWHVAIILILLERVGKGIRAPAKSALTSFTTPHLGAGKAFALQEAMDQFGAFLGPLFVFGVLSFHQGSELSGYQLAFGLLGIVAILTLTTLVVAKWKYPHPEEFETQTLVKGFKGNKSFVWYMVAISFIAFGFIDYPILAFHLNDTRTIDVIYVPLLYSLAMGVDAIAALVFGVLFDKKGIKVLQLSVFISMFFAPVFFLLNGVAAIIMGVVLWGIGMGAQESILKAVISNVVSKDKRATAYGIFYTVFGLSWFLGSVLIGALYAYSILAIVLISVTMESIAIIVLIFLNQSLKKEKMLKN
ncbi:MAG: MFS transporter [Acholeplasmataceae bacterium]|nr:MFS transporter [Acholeplasmataceae bacterium]